MRYGDDPADWIVRGGHPARCLGDPRGPVGGLPSYEHEDGEIVVFEFAVVQRLGSNGCHMLFPRNYGIDSILSQDSMVPLHHTPPDVQISNEMVLMPDDALATLWLVHGENEGAKWEWRPCLYRTGFFGYWQGLGSQTELGWRFGLMEVQHNTHTGSNITMQAADEKAEALLDEHLSPYQRLEWRTSNRGQFRVRGAATGNLYEVNVGDGFYLLDKTTGERLRSYCFHPEEWLPAADVALSTKFALEDEELEIEALENARSYERDEARRATPADYYARDLEKELIA